MLQHILENWKTSLAGFLLAVLAIAQVFSQAGVTLGKVGNSNWITLIIGCVGAVLGLIAVDPKNLKALKQAANVGVFLLACAFLSVPAQAQTLSTQATASAFRYHSAWTAGTEQTQSSPLIYFGAQKGNVVSLGAREMIAPGTFSTYGALANFQPDISSLMKKTTLNPDQFSLSLDVMGGVATLPNSITKSALEGRVNVSYAFTPNIGLTGAYAGGGLIGNDRFVVVSAGLQYIFGAQNSPSQAMRRMQAKAMAKKLATAVAAGRN